MDYQAKAREIASATRPVLDIALSSEGSSRAGLLEDALSAAIASALSEAVEPYRKGVRAALTEITKHDEAPFQCESVEGAEGASECRRTLEALLRGEEAKDAE